MKCIKCGKDTTGSAVFCNECLADMENHPVKPGTPIILPKRAIQQPAKHSRKRAVKPEQQIQSLKAGIRLLLIMVVILIVALAISIAAIVHLMDESSSTLPFGLNDQDITISQSTDE